MINLCCEYISAWGIWLYVLVMSHTCFRVNPHSFINQLVHKRKVNIFSTTGHIIDPCCEYLFVRCIWLYVLLMSRTRFRMNPHSIVGWMSRYSFLSRREIWSLSDSNWTGTCNHLVHKQTLSHLKAWERFAVVFFIFCF